MVGIVTAVLVSIGSAAAVLAAIARRHTPEGGWRDPLRAGVHAARRRQLSFRDDHKTDDGATGGVADLFSVAQPVDWPAYTEVTELRTALRRIREAGRRRARRPGPSPDRPAGRAPEEPVPGSSQSAD